MEDLGKRSNTLLIIIAICTSLVGVFLAGLGSVLVYLGAVGDSNINIFDNILSSESVGVASIFVGAVLTIVVFGRILASHDHVIKPKFSFGTLLSTIVKNVQNNDENDGNSHHHHNSITAMNHYFTNKSSKFNNANSIKLLVVNAHTVVHLIDTLEKKKLPGELNILVMYPYSSRTYPVQHTRLFKEASILTNMLEKFEEYDDSNGDGVRFSRCRVRGYFSDPSYRAVFIDDSEGFVGPYKIVPRQHKGIYICDIKGNDQAGCSVSRGHQDIVRATLFDTVLDRFETIWKFASIPVYPKPYVLFDFDGTLVDTKDKHLSAWKQAAKECNTIWSENIKHDISMFLDKGKCSQEIVSSVFKHIPTKEQQKLRSKKHDYFDNSLEDIQIHGKIKDCLMGLKERGIRWGLFSTNREEAIRHILGEQLSCLAQDIVGRESNIQKSEPHALKKFCKKTLVNMEDIVVVGDSITDANLCSNANVPFIHFLAYGSDAHSVYNESIWKEERKEEQIPRWIRISSITDLCDFFSWYGQK